MTDAQERAKAVLKDLSLVEADEIIETQEKMKAMQVDLIATAMAQVEAETWERAEETWVEANTAAIIERADRMTAQARVAELEERLQVTVEKLARLQAFVDTSQWKRDLTTVERERDGARQQLTAGKQYLEQQRTATYQAVKREHAAKQQLADAQTTIARLEKAGRVVGGNILQEENAKLRVENRKLQTQLEAMTQERDEAVTLYSLEAEKERKLSIEFGKQNFELTVVKQQLAAMTIERNDLDDTRQGLEAELSEVKQRLNIMNEGYANQTQAVARREAGFQASIDQLQATVAAQQKEIGRLKLALLYLSELGGGNSEGNYYAKATLKREDNIRATLASGKETT